MPIALLFAGAVQAHEMPPPVLLPPMEPIEAYVSLPKRQVVFVATKRRQRRLMACLGGASALSAGTYAMSRGRRTRPGLVITSGTLLGVAVTCGVGAAWIGPR